MSEERCPECSKIFPDWLLEKLVTGATDGGVVYTAMCPLCALKRVNLASGLPEGTPFRGPRARENYRLAEDHLKRSGQ